MSNTRKAALIELRDKVKAGEWDTRFDEPDKATGLRDWALTVDRIICNNDLNAAKALHEAVLHEKTFVQMHWSKRYEDETYVTITGLDQDRYIARSTPARAWLIAILEAIIAQDGEA